MLLSEIYKEKVNHVKKAKFMDSEIDIKLFMHDEAQEFALLLDDEKIDEFIAKSVFEDGKSIFEKGLVDIFSNMPNAHKRELLELITKVNGGNSSFEQKKSE